MAHVIDLSAEDLEAALEKLRVRQAARQNASSSFAMLTPSLSDQGQRHRSRGSGDDAHDDVSYRGSAGKRVDPQPLSRHQQHGGAGGAREEAMGRHIRREASPDQHLTDLGSRSRPVSSSVKAQPQHQPPLQFSAKNRYSMYLS